MIDKGRLIDAVMASIAIPGFIEPVECGGVQLVDGGIVNPVPVNALIRDGIKRIIAVNVLPPPEEAAGRKGRRLNIYDIVVNSFLAAIGQGDVSMFSAVNRLYPQTEEDSKETIEEIITDRTRFRGGIKIDDIKSLQFNFGKCCQPVPGEDVVGFITRGRGVTVHRSNCPNIQRANIDKARIIALDWDISEQSKFVVKISLIMEDRKNILRDILNSIADDETNLKNSSISASKGLARGEFIAEVRNLTHLNRILDQIKKVKGVIDVTRSMGSSKK